MHGLPVLAVIALFVGGAIVTWGAGIALSRTTDELDRRLGIGDALGGMVLLAIAGSLPELAITVAAAASGHIELAAGNLIGGIATQTMVLVLCDLAAPRPLTFLVGSLEPVLEGLLVIAVIAVVVMGALLPGDVTLFHGLSPASLAVVVLWIGGILVLNRVRKHPRWEVVMEGSRPGRKHRRIVHPTHKPEVAKRSLAVVAGIFGAACVLTLGAGVVLEVTGSELAGRAGIDGIVFGATILAVASALPEISSGIEAVRLGDHRLAVGDIFGGNAFQLCLFVVADLVAGKAALEQAGAANSWLAALGIALTAVYVGGIIVRPSRPNRLGPDSILAIVMYVIGIVGLLKIAG